MNIFMIKITNFKERIADYAGALAEADDELRIIKERLKDIGITDVEIVEHEGIGEIVAPHYEIMVGDETVVFIYKPLSCHS